MSKNIPATGKRVLITLASSEFKGKIGKLVEETTEGAWWVSLNKGRVLEVMAPQDFVVLQDQHPRRKKVDDNGLCIIE